MRVHKSPANKPALQASGSELGSTPTTVATTKHGLTFARDSTTSWPSSSAKLDRSSFLLCPEIAVLLLTNLQRNL
jgi:hypothetical protein